MMIKIRKAKRKDFEDFLKLKKESIKEYSNLIKEKINAKEEQIKKEFYKMISSKNNIVLVLNNDKNLIGFLIGSIIKNIWQNSGYIDDVFVLKKFRKNRLASNLIKEFIKILKVKGIKKCRLGANIKNKNALKLYKKLGFKIVRYEMDLKI